MLVMHTIMTVLNIDFLVDHINDLRAINLIALVLLPFFGGLAGFFLLVSSASNMVSMFNNLKKSKSVKSIVIKQVVGGVVLLIFAMITESITGYFGLLGNTFAHLNNPSLINWHSIQYKWNHFETIHTIAWCIIINGIVQGLLSLKDNWKNTRDLIISYALFAFMVILFTLPVWTIIGNLIPGYPYGTNPITGTNLSTPWIGKDSFWHLLRAPFLAMLAAPEEPLFPYLAVSFIGSIIGIIISQPKEKIKPNFPRNGFLAGLAMFVTGIFGLGGVFISIYNTVGPSEGIDAILGLYQELFSHRDWTPDHPTFGAYTPHFSWLAQFLFLNGFSLMMVMFLFRLIEFRGKSKGIAKRTKIFRRFGIIALTNYNIQWIFYLMFALVSFSLLRIPYQRMLWAGTFLTIFLTLAVFILLLWLWEKIGYVGSFEWLIRTFINNTVSVRREQYKDMKWWQRGKLEVDRVFYNAKWIDITASEMQEQSSDRSDSKFALTLSFVGMFSIIFCLASIISLILAILSFKREGKNKQNLTAMILSIITLVAILAVTIVLILLPIELLGLF
jgi:hypothetical protein